MPALKPETRGQLLKVGVAVLTNGLLKRGLRNQFLHGIAPVAPNMPAMAGPAFTLRFIPAREDIDTIEALRRPDNVQRRVRWKHARRAASWSSILSVARGRLRPAI